MHDAGGLEPTCKRIEMRVLIKGHQCIGRRNHGFSQVAVHIERADDRARRSNDGAHPLQQIALAIQIAVGHHGPVQGEQHAAHGHGRREPAEQVVAQPFVSVAGDQSTWHSRGIQ